VVDAAEMALLEIRANSMLTHCPFVVAFSDAWFDEGRPHIPLHHA
jgi:hypothetical protein